ncbi:MAG: heavy-metal-associated domain-containing protein [Bacillales bacterium]|mgnify:CR=1 FL=1|nr:heavy-metal-associated domain-containing protein [Bacillales bacterium]
MFDKKIKKVITIEGMMCSHCQMKVEKSLLELNGVSKVKVNLKDKTATIYSTKIINNDDIKKIITKLDYKVIDIKDNNE